ncbi:hypothetical protein EIP91_002636 [Steccherinum ochraceum]|uniref:Uncharacterized protein n=1 Tax=Steccherinum ochraceum TaxID=92696 RepID=A0A4R0RS06_9APHY|nr:hypothetical protein EIP91_002636 [Steccherinum ochraceum]
MSLAIGPVVELYRYLLQPVAPFTWFGQNISTLDVLAIFRLCIVLRQFKEGLHKAHVAKAGHAVVEPRSFVRDAAATLTVVYGGEVITAPLLGVPPSFMVSGVVPALYAAGQAIVEHLPAVPVPQLTNELPLALLDGLTRAYLLCNLIPPVVVKHASETIATSPWTLLITSFLTVIFFSVSSLPTNGGFFFTGLFSLLHPSSISVATPGELLPYGWTTTDLWCAPLITGLFATLTHAQPFWADTHAVLSGWLGYASAPGVEKIAPVDPETARAVCAVILASLFTTRVLKNFGVLTLGKPAEKRQVKEKTQ